MIENLKGKRVLKGCASSQGIVIGPVRNIGKDDPELASQLQPGEVLVAEANRNLYSAIPKGVTINDFFDRPLAFVTNRGGPLSSVAIISREHDVPAVTGTNEATTVLKTGQLVVVDGNEGAVYTLAKII